MGLVPYVDFSIFGPHGARAERKQCFQQNVFIHSVNEWRLKEFPGPQDHPA